MKNPVVILIRNASSYDFGGGERVPVFIGREAMKHNIHPLIFSRSEKLRAFAKKEGVPNIKTWWWSRQSWNGAKVLLIPLYIVWQIVLFFNYVTLFAKYRPSVVHVQSKDDFIAGTYAARLLGARVIWSDHADLKHIFKNHRIWYKNPVGKMVYQAAHFADNIFVVSKEDKRLIAESIPDHSVLKKMEIVYNGAFDSYKPVEKYKKFTFVSTGRLVTDKGIGELIDAFIKFHDNIPDSQLYLLSDGPERGRFEKQATAHPAIHFLGYKENPLEYVAKSHVFLLPTYHEGFSLALVEACMLAMPIIATNVGGNPEIIRDHDNGLLVAAKSSDGPYEAMKVLYSDKDLREKVSQNARKEYVGKFNFETIIRDNFISYYRGKS